MVPQRLSMRNFLCYRENCPPLDLSDIRVACLSGENGHGKSALLDAVTWAVWGEARARTDDELIHVGRVDMEVEFDFRVGDVQYRVVRKRRKGTLNGPGRTILEFQVLSLGDWKSLSGITVRETQARIIQAVRLDYDTFRNSAFLVQGRADEFTLKAPGERKRVLGEILGLGAYDGYEAKARDERRRWEAEARRLDALLTQYAAEIEREPVYLRERGETFEELTSIERELGDRRASSLRLQEIERQVQLLRSQAETAERDRRQAAERVERQCAEQARQQAVIDRYQAILERVDQIRVFFEELKAARLAESEQSRRLATVVGLRRDEAAALAEVERERGRLRSRADVVGIEMQRFQTQAGRSANLEAERGAIDAERIAVKREERRVDDMRRELEEQLTTVGELQAANKRLRDDMEGLKRRQTELQDGGALCPVCRTELGADGKQRLYETYEHEGSELADLFRQNRNRREAAEARSAAVQEEIKRVDEAAGRDRAALERRTAGLDRDERETLSAAQALPPLLKELEKITGNLSAEGFAPEARARLQDIGANIDATDYDEVAHELAREAVQRLAGADAEYTELLRAEEVVQAARAAIDRARQELDEWQATLVQAEQRAKELAELLAAQKDPRADLIRVGGEIGALEASERRLRLALGAAEQRLEDCRRFRRLHELQSLEMAKARSEQQIYDDLATAFGRKGVQALIIDAVIPEIEEEANRLLSRMTNGRMSVALHTQRERQRGGATETLDITIADELGTRAYEMFSGGEAFRINLSLRIALSKLLARRAGAPLPTLIVDEGFGTQDAAGRERLLEAINAVSRDFECLIVITHIDELRDQFDRQIRVEKRPEGSLAWIE